MNTLLKPSETDDADAIASAYLYAAKGDSRAALTQAVSDAVVAIEELRSRLEQAEQVVWLHTWGIRDTFSLLNPPPKSGTRINPCAIVVTSVRTIQRSCSLPSANVAEPVSRRIPKRPSVVPSIEPQRAC